jgi:hypothetical protein
VTQCLRFRAALKSRSWTAPHSAQTHLRSLSVSVCFTAPHAEHVFDDGKKRYCKNCTWEWAHPIAPDAHYCFCPAVSLWCFKRSNAGPVPCDHAGNLLGDCEQWEAKG